MKKNLFKMMLATVAVVAGSVSICNSQKEYGMSDIALANVEALAESECEYILSGPMNYHITYLWVCSWRCTPGGVWQCPM